MSDPILHIKDGYFFQFPRRWITYDWHSLADVPLYVRADHPEIKNVHVFNEAMAGKWLIPQWFGTPKTLFQPGTGLCISKFMIIELLVALIMAVVFIRLATRARDGERPRGTIWNMLEAFLVYLRDTVIRPSIGEHDADRYVPLLWTMFFFILGCNLMGLVPWLGSPTAAASVTLALAIVIFATGIVMGIAKLGPLGWIGHFVPHMDIMLLLKIPLWLAIFGLEIWGTLVKHAVLGIRLLANMVAGHLVLLGILGIITAMSAAGLAQFSGVSLIVVIGSVLLDCLELFVAFLQAYVFVFLSAIFIGASIHSH